MIDGIDSLQKIKVVFFAKPHVGLVKHVEGVGLEHVKEEVRRMLEDMQISRYKVIEAELDKRVDVVAHLTYKGSALKLWITLTERSDVGCVIEVKTYHEYEESAEADEYLSLLSKVIDERIAGA